VTPPPAPEEPTAPAVTTPQPITPAEQVAKVLVSANGGKFKAGKKAIYIAAGTKLGKVQVPARAGYNFKGWYTAKTGGKKLSASTTITKTMKIYAHWTRK